MIIHDVEQSSLPWMQLHIGIPTAGALGNLLTPEFELRKGETPKTYIYKKASEAWRGKPLLDLSASSFMMEQGMILESEALPFWELTTGRKATRVGFITTDDGRFGCSPDALLMEEETGLEIKCPAPHTHVKYLADGVIPKEYRAQVWGGMFAMGWKRWAFMSYCRGFPPLILEAVQDSKAKKSISEAVGYFHLEFDRVKTLIDRWQKNPRNEFRMAASEKPARPGEAESQSGSFARRSP